MKRLRLVVVALLVLLAAPAQAAIAVVAGRTDLLGQNNNATTTAIDTTGSSLIVVSLVWYSAISPTATFTDSKGNTWTSLTAQTENDGTVRQWYSVNPTVGSGHTWTGGGESDTYSVIHILAFSGTHASAPFDQQSGATGLVVTSLAPGSITPSGANQVFVTSAANMTAAVTTLPTGYTGATVDFSGGVNVGSGIAYKIQSGGASAENPAWTWSVATNAAAVMSTFKEAAAGGPTCRGGLLLRGVGGC